MIIFALLLAIVALVAAHPRPTISPDGTDPDLTPFAWTCPHVHSDSATYYEFIRNDDKANIKRTDHFKIMSTTGDPNVPLKSSEDTDYRHADDQLRDGEGRVFAAESIKITTLMKRGTSCRVPWCRPDEETQWDQAHAGIWTETEHDKHHLEGVFERVEMAAQGASELVPVEAGAERSEAMLAETQRPPPWFPPPYFPTPITPPPKQTERADRANGKSKLFGGRGIEAVHGEIVKLSGAANHEIRQCRPPFCKIHEHPEPEEPEGDLSTGSRAVANSPKEPVLVVVADSYEYR